MNPIKKPCGGLACYRTILMTCKITKYTVLTPQALSGMGHPAEFCKTDYLLTINDDKLHMSNKTTIAIVLSIVLMTLLAFGSVYFAFQVRLFSLNANTASSPTANPDDFKPVEKKMRKVNSQIAIGSRIMNFRFCIYQNELIVLA
jgi:hypothetical protein